MALTSPKSNNLNTSLSSDPNLTIPNEALEVKGTSQVALLSQRVTDWRKTSLVARKSKWVNGRVNATEAANTQFSCLTPTSLEGGHDTESIIRASQMVRAQLMHVASSSISNEVFVVESEEKKKAWEMLQSELLRASALVPKNEVVVGGTSEPASLDMERATLMIAPPVQNQNHILNGLSQLEPSSGSESSGLQRVVDDVGEKGKAGKYDGRIHSFPYKKNGPYTCPKCENVFNTSQKFAAHVSSTHYKYETNSERKQRLMVKVKGRNLRLQQVNDALTIVPDNAVSAGNDNNNIVVTHPRLKAEVISEFGAEIAPPPGMDKIKLEPVDAHEPNN